MKIRSKEELEDYLQKELAWRKKELSLILSNHATARESNKEFFWRSGIVLIYAHWEGFTKKAAQAYLTYLNFKGYKYLELTSNFVAVGIPEQFQGEIALKQFNSYEVIVDFFQTRLTDKFHCDPEKVINTKSNLNYETFNEIASIIDIKDEFFELKKNLIDEQLIKYRNKIAHGEQIHGMEISLIGLDFIKNEILEMIEFVNTKIQNALTMESYLKMP